MNLIYFLNLVKWTIYASISVRIAPLFSWGLFSPLVHIGENVWKSEGDIFIEGSWSRVSIWIASLSNPQLYPLLHLVCSLQHTPEFCHLWTDTVSSADFLDWWEKICPKSQQICVSIEGLLLLKQTTQFFPALMDHSRTCILGSWRFQKRLNSMVGTPGSLITCPPGHLQKEKKKRNLGDDTPHTSPWPVLESSLWSWCLLPHRDSALSALLVQEALSPVGSPH